MGRYIDWSAVVARYPEAARIAGAVEASSSWIMQAEYEVDAYLGRRYTVPFTPAPPVVQDLATDLAYFKMTARTKGSQLLKEYIDSRITALLDGDMVLTVESLGLLSAPGDTVGSNTLEAGTSFGMDEPECWWIDDTGVNLSRDDT